MEVTESDIPIKLRTAYKMAEASPDQSTKLGAIICHEGWNVAKGVNEFVKGYGDRPEHHERPFKYWVTEHAERNVIFAALRRHYDLHGLTMVAPWVCCPDCARAIVLSGLKCVVGHKECIQRTPERWRESIEVGHNILKQGGVELIQWSGKVGGVEHLMNEVLWQP